MMRFRKMVAILSAFALLAGSLPVQVFAEAAEANTGTPETATAETAQEAPAPDSLPEAAQENAPATMPPVQANTAAAEKRPEYVEGEAIVRVAGGAAALTAAAESAEEGGLPTYGASFAAEDLMTLEHTAATGGQEKTYAAASGGESATTSLVLVQSALNTEQLISAIEQNPAVVYAEPNYYVYPDSPDSKEPTDPYYPYQSGLNNQLNRDAKESDHQAETYAADMDVIPIWEKASTEGADTPVVAVLDTGVDYNHPDLKGIMWDKGDKISALTELGGGKYGINVVTNEDSTDPMDTHIGHGTHCAGIVAAQWNDLGIAGVSDAAKIMAVRVMGVQSGSEADILRAFRYVQTAKENGVNVVATNNSYGPATIETPTLRSISDAVTELGNLGVISCFAAGNENADLSLNPSGIKSSPYSLTVGATESTGIRAGYSNYSATLTDVFAPGTQILSTTTTYENGENLVKNHEMPAQYLPQLMEQSDSLYYEDFESGTSSLTMRLYGASGSEMRTEAETPCAGYKSEQGESLPLNTLTEEDAAQGVFHLVVSFPRTELEGYDNSKPLHIAFQIGTDALGDASCVLNSAYYKDDGGSWVEISGVKSFDGSSNVAQALHDGNWNQVSFELENPDALMNVKSEQVELLFSFVGSLDGYNAENARLRMDDFGFGQSTVPYCYASGTSMACPMVAGLVALTYTRSDASADKTLDGEEASEIAARIKGAVNRNVDDAMKNASLSCGRIDAAKILDDAELVPVLDTLDVQGKTATLSGHFFGNAEGAVNVGGNIAEVTAWSDTSIQFNLPDNLKGLTEVIVARSDENLSWGHNFFSFEPDAIGYTDLTAPSFKSGSAGGYPLSSESIASPYMVGAGNKIYMAGQIEATGEWVFLSYAVKDDAWSLLELPEDCDKDDNTFFTMAAGKDKIYAAYDSATSKGPVLATLDTGTDRWTAADTVGVIREYSSLAVWNNQLLMIGGMDADSHPVQTVEILDPATGKVTGKLPDLPESRASALAVANGKTLILCSGMDSKMKAAGTCFAYDGSSWKTCQTSEMLSTVNNLTDNGASGGGQQKNISFVAADGGLLVVGPVNDLGESTMQDTWLYSLADDQWAARKDVLYSSQKTTNLGACCYGGKMYVLSTIVNRQGYYSIFRSLPVSCTDPAENPGETPTPTATPDDATGRLHDFVTRLYRVCLNRTPDADGFKYWTNGLANGSVTGADAAYGFVFSKEFTAKQYGNADFVSQLYRTMLGREPDAAGLADWVGRLQKGASREDVFFGFAHSAEFLRLCTAGGIQCDKVTDFVTRLYRIFLDRAPDAAGLLDWSGKLWGKSITATKAAHGFVFSQEFTAKKYDNAAYVRRLYRALLDREPDAEGLANWVSRLDKGASREDVFKGFAGSQEFARLCASYQIAR